MIDGKMDRRGLLGLFGGLLGGAVGEKVKVAQEAVVQTALKSGGAWGGVGLASDVMMDGATRSRPGGIVEAVRQAIWNRSWERDSCDQLQLGVDRRNKVRPSIACFKSMSKTVQALEEAKAVQAEMQEIEKLRKISQMIDEGEIDVAAVLLAKGLM